MALLWIDGFEGYGTSLGADPAPVGVVGRRYMGIVDEDEMAIQSGKISGYALQFPWFNSSMTTPVLTTDDTLTAGVAFKVVGVSESPILSFYDGATQGMNIRRKQGEGEIELYRNTTLITATHGLNLLLNTWYYAELQIKCDNATGEYELRINGNVVLSDTGVDTQAGTHTYHDAVRLKSGNPTAFMTFDDFYILDSTGSNNNDFLDPQRIVAIYPDGDDTANWSTVVPGANHFESVDEAIVDNNTTYVEEDTVNVTDLYDYEATPSLGGINGLQINTDCRETDADPFDLKTPISSNGTQNDGSGDTVGTTSWVTKMRISETDPDTGNAWLEAGINAAKFGIKIG